MTEITPRRLHARRVTLWLAAALVAGCQDPVDKDPADKDPGDRQAAPLEDAAAAGTPASGFLPAAAPAAACPEGGRVSGRLYGALEGAIDWAAPQMSCEGMPRPAGAGARLRFAGSAGDDRALAVIIGIPGLERGVAGRDLPSNVTIIEEGRGRFFSTTDPGYCWVDVRQVDAVSGTITSVDGTLNCIAPLAETNGESSITIDNLSFLGFVDWSDG